MLVDKIFKIGILLGISIFNLGVIVWLLSVNIENKNLRKVAKDLMQSSALLVISALILYIW
jgi:hypothetical protein